MENPILDELINDDKVVKEAEALSETQKTELVDMHQRASLRAIDALSPEEREKAKELAKQLDENSAQSVIAYGANAQDKISAFSQSVLDKVQAQDLGDVGGSLTDLMYNLQQANPNELVAENKSVFQKCLVKLKINL